MYKLLLDPINGRETNVIIRTLDNVFIPMNPANTDYQAYLKWLSEGNEPLPADEQPK